MTDDTKATAPSSPTPPAKKVVDPGDAAGSGNDHELAYPGTVQIAEGADAQHDAITPLPVVLP